MTIPIDQQIEWLRKHIRNSKIAYPERVARGQMQLAHATHLLACAESTLQTLSQLRALARPDSSQDSPA